MKGETKLFLGIIIGTIVIVGAGIALLSRPASSTKVDSSLLIRADSNKISTPSATVTLVEFSDFQCPACGTYYPVVTQTLKDFKDSLTFVYRNFPLTDFHPNAQMAAQAAEAAGVQGKYWEMHDLLFTKQSDWSTSGAVKDVFAQYAESLGLNMDQFKKDIDSDAVKNKVAQDVNDGKALGITGTPTFFLDGVKLDNPATLADFEALVKAEIQKTPKPTVSKTAAYHIHANFMVYTNGTAVDFSKDNEMNPDIHIHNNKGDLIHIHKQGMTLGDFFTSIQMTFSKNSYTLFVNGKENTQFMNYVLQDLDKILITNATDEVTVQKQIASVPDDACIYSLKCPQRGTPPPENCPGGLGTDCTD
jgi:protein-disulfide isomerase